jgi:hypothetical protein
MIFFSLMLWAHAGINDGVDLTKIEGLRSSVFQSHETGWMGTTADGLLRVYIGTSPEEATIWMDLMKKRLYKYVFPIIEDRGDEAYGDLSSIMMLRHGNIVLLSQGKNVFFWMTTLEGLITIPHSNLSQPPTVQPYQEGLFDIIPPEGLHLSFIGGHPTYDEAGLHFKTLPNRITLWDDFGRSDLWSNQDSKSFTPTEKSLGIQPK